MGKIWMPGGGNSTDLDMVTASAGDVLTGKVIVDTEGESVTGTMANRGAVSQSLNAGTSYTIPAGYHNGSGIVTGNSLSSQTSGTAVAGNILSGRTAWVNGSQLTGTIASLAGSTVTPGASQQTVSSSGKYMTGNVVVSAVANLSAANIKKGVTVGGVTGTWEGYVPTTVDLYLRGNNIAGFTVFNEINISGDPIPVFDSAQITFNNVTSYTPITASKNLTGHNTVSVQYYRTTTNYQSVHLCVGQNKGFYMSSATTGDYGIPDDAIVSSNASGDNIITLDISAVNAVRWIKFGAGSSSTASSSSKVTCYVYRIWFD